jgi:serine/threonine protein kinase
VAEPGAETASSATQTGFDQAQQLAAEAASREGRLLKDRFVLEDVMGEGGMGRVYRARDLRKVEAEDRNPYIAVKVLGEGFRQHPQAFVSLQQESVKSQRLAHPNIVTVYDFDRDGDTIYMTMELLKGDPLDQLIRLEAPFSKEAAFRYFAELCSGLEYAHKRGLVHSDFKPGNIFVTASGNVKILDFGIARAARSNASTHDYDVGDLGALTPAYATQEMVRGEPPSDSDDVYALACVLYIMLTGVHPYGRVSAAEAAEKKLKPKRPDCLNNREWQALSKALAVEKSARTPTIAKFREGILPAPKTGAIKWFVAAALLVAVVGGFLAWRQQQLTEEQKELIAKRLQEARDCFVAEDYDCAIENALVVQNLDEGNSESSSILTAAQSKQMEQANEARADRLLSEARACRADGDYPCARIKLQELSELKPGDPAVEELIASVEEDATRAAIADRVDAVQACLESGDVDCAERAIAAARSAGATGADLYDVQQRLDARRADLAEVAAEQAARVASLVAEGEACLDRSDFACAAERAQAALDERPGAPDAIALKQSIEAARDQLAADRERVQTFLSQAGDCFERRDYSCAIARAESALALLPGEPSAKAMIEKAEAAQRKLKMNIQIQ